MRTAMQELYADLERFKEIADNISIIDVQRMIGYYSNEKEKEQIKTAFNDGASWELYGNNITHEERANKYFNEIFFK